MKTFQTQIQTNVESQVGISFNDMGARCDRKGVRRRDLYFKEANRRHTAYLKVLIAF